MKNIIYSDIEGYMDSINKKIGDNTNNISDHVLIAIGLSCYGDYKSYFGPDCIKDYVKDLLEIKTQNNFNLNKPIKFNKEDNLYHDTKNTCHICNKHCITKVRDHCHETSNYRCPACNICNLKYKQKTSSP